MEYKEKNPVDFEFKLAYLFQATGGFKDLTVFDRSAESRISAQFKDAVTTISSNTDITSRNLSRKNPSVVDIESIDDIV